MFLYHVVVSSILALQATAFDNSRFDNVAVYWGQNSLGATNPTDTAQFQQRLSFYCTDDAIDVFPVAFLNVFFGAGGAPSINLANICSPSSNTTFPGTTLPDCSSLAPDIISCQAKGKIVTMSLGGASGAVGFQSSDQATSFAQTIWDMFLGGSSSTRPFGAAVLDGVDLDIEGGSSAFYDVFVNSIRSLSAGASKQYYVTAAPQCPFPDAALGSVLNAANFDAVYVQFYNNFCGLQTFPNPADWNFGVWDNWARTMSPNKNAKVYIGAPGSTLAAGSGFVTIDKLSSIAVQMRQSFPSFGGVMLWDASQAHANNRYDLAIKNALVAAGGTGFSFPTCSAPAFVSGTNYVAGSQVTFDGYIWQAKFFASSQPSSNPGGEWGAISACSGPGASVPSSSTPSSSTLSSSTPSSSTSTATTAAPTSGGASCTGVAAWSSTVAYPGGSQVVFNSHLWTTKFFSEADIPGGTSGDWTDLGPCSQLPGAAAKVFISNKPQANFAPKVSNLRSRYFKL